MVKELITYCYQSKLNVIADLDDLKYSFLFYHIDYLYLLWYDHTILLI